MLLLGSACTNQAATCRRTVVQQAACARLPLRVALSRSSYFGQTLRPQIAKALQLPARGRSGSRGLQVEASFFGVGAPEAILVGVVALLVFGPKGLAQAAKSLGQTLRAFQPTIRELTQVSAELKSSLETEIGINEIKEELRRPMTVARSADEQGSSLAELADDMTAKVKGAREDMAKMMDPEIERKREESARAAWGDAAAPAATSAAAAATAAGPPAPAAAAAAPQQQQQQQPKPAASPAALDSLSVEQLEAELQRRRAVAAAAQQVPKELRADD